MIPKIHKINSIEFKTFETERLFLRPTDTIDAEFILELMNTPKWLAYIGERNVNTVNDAKMYILSRMQPQFFHLNFGNYTVIRKSDNIKIGTCGLYDREGLDGIDIGFAFLPEYEQKGYAFEAANRLKEAAALDFGIKKLYAITVKENLASQKLLTKLGMEFIGTTRIPNDNEELLAFKIEL